MNVIFILIIISIVMATGFLFSFLWAVRSGQYEDITTPPMRILLPDSPTQFEKCSNLVLEKNNIGDKI